MQEKTLKKLPSDELEHILRFSSWSSSELSQIKFTASSIQQADFSNATLREIDFRRAQIFNTDFTGSDLSIADFTAARLENVNFQGTNLDPKYFQEAYWRECTFDRRIDAATSTINPNPDKPEGITTKAQRHKR